MDAKILLLCVSSQSVINFRQTLIKKLQAEQYLVSVVAFDEDYKKEVEDLDVDFYCIQDKNRSLNPLKVLSLKSKYYKLIKEIAPDIVFSFMLKPNTFGVMAAKKANVKKIFSMVEGAGDVFIKNTLKWKVIRSVVCLLYKRAFIYSNKVFFLNNDDKQEFVERKLVKEEQGVVIHGIGVDLEKFAFKPMKNQKTFLMIARMLRTKGVLEYCQTARIVKEKYPDAIFNYLGAEGDLKLADIQEYIADGSVNYLGTAKDVRPYIEDCTALLLLSSYREGLPMSIMEAQSVGRAIITSNNVGCRDTVIDGVNGFLVEQRDYKTMAEKCIWVIKNPEKVEEMGKNARAFAEENFNQEKTNRALFGIINE